VIKRNAVCNRVRDPSLCDMKRQPGFTFIETMVAVLCVILFVFGLQRFLLFTHSRHSSAMLQQELTSISDFIAIQMKCNDISWIQEETFSSTPGSYRRFTHDPLMTIPIEISSAESFFHIRLSDELKQRPYTLFISKSSAAFYGQDYVMYRVIVYCNSFSTIQCGSSVFMK